MSRRAAARMTRRRVVLSAAAGVGMLLLGGRAFAASRPWFSQRQQGLLVFRADFPLEQVDAELLCVGPTMRQAVESLGLSARRKPAAFYLLADESSYRRYLAEHLPGVGYRRSLFLQGRTYPMVFAQKGPHLATDLRHESTHAALHTLWNEVPLWLDEGLAEYCEVVPGDRVAAHPWLASVRQLNRKGALPALEPLEGRTPTEPMTDSDYRAAWAWVHFFLNGPDALRRVFREYCHAWDRYDAASQSVMANHPLSEEVPRSRRPTQPERLSRLLTRQSPDWREQFRRHFDLD